MSSVLKQSTFIEIEISFEDIKLILEISNILWVFFTPALVRGRHIEL